MTLQDSYLTEAAKALNNESFLLPSHVGVSNQDSTVGVTANSLTNEIGSRSTANSSRNNDTITYEAVRQSTAVVDTTNGDTIEEIGFFNTSTGGTMLTFDDIPGIEQTIDFDVDITKNVTMERS